MKVLYLSNIEVPYRVEFFNQLSKKCELTVLYERHKSSNRDEEWTCSKKNIYKTIYLNGINIGNENAFSLQIVNIVSQKWDIVIVGCYNSIVQMFAIMYMKLKGIKYIISLDGEPFIRHDLKGKLKKYFLKGASAYLVAGEKASYSLRKAICDRGPIIPYYFSSLTAQEIDKNAEMVKKQKRNGKVLVIGQYFPYKGMDIAYKVACLNYNISFKFVGMGKRSDKFVSDMGFIPDNIEIIPFLQKDNLKLEYQNCSVLLLPTRQECWGLVVNEAASFGMPIVSTWGSGAAKEFLGTKYSKYLAEPENVNELYDCVKKCLCSNDENYSNYLKEVSRNYTIEKMVQCHINLFCKILGK